MALIIFMKIDLRKIKFFIRVNVRNYLHKLKENYLT